MVDSFVLQSLLPCSGGTLGLSVTEQHCAVHRGLQRRGQLEVVMVIDAVTSGAKCLHLT